MERSPLFYETVWASAYAAHVAMGRTGEQAAYAANETLRCLRAEEAAGEFQIAEREKLLHEIRAGSAK